LANLKFVYFGTSDFAVPPLLAISDSVVAVVAQPGRPTGRGMKIQKSPVQVAAEEIGLHVLTPEKARDPQFVELIEGYRVDALIVAAYGQILSQRLLDAGKHGGINLHGSILPKYRGAAPIQRAIENGDLETGVTLMQMDKGMDTGDIIDIVRTEIDPEETYGQLQARLSKIAATQLREWAPRIAVGEYNRTPQQHDESTHAAKIDRAETEIKFDDVAMTAYRKFRAFTPAPSTFILSSEGRIKLGSVRYHDVSDFEPGTILNLNPLIIQFCQGSLEIISLQPEGKSRQSGTDWANGRRLKVGDRLTSGTKLSIGDIIVQEK
jgi:methionyl-tRNA formyltransferase